MPRNRITTKYECPLPVMISNRSPINSEDSLSDTVKGYKSYELWPARPFRRNVRPAYRLEDANATASA